MSVHLLIDRLFLFVYLFVYCSLKRLIERRDTQKRTTTHLIVLDEIEVALVPRHILLVEYLAQRLKDRAARNGLDHGRRAVVVAQDPTELAIELVAQRRARVH